MVACGMIWFVWALSTASLTALILSLQRGQTRLNWIRLKSSIWVVTFHSTTIWDTFVQSGARPQKLNQTAVSDNSRIYYFKISCIEIMVVHGYDSLCQFIFQWLKKIEKKNEKKAMTFFSAWRNLIQIFSICYHLNLWNGLIQLEMLVAFLCSWS